MTERRALVERVTWGIAATVLVALLIVAVRRLDLARAVAELGRAHLAWVLVAMLCYLAILPLWAVQWRILAPAGPRVTVSRMLRVVASTSSVLNTTPLLVGEASGVHFLSTQAGVDRGSAVAVLAMDQLLVGLAKIAVVSAAAWTLPLPGVMRQGLHALIAGVGVLLVLMIVFMRTGSRTDRWLAAHLPVRLASALGRMRAGLAPLGSPSRGGAALLLALLKKGAELVAILAIQRAFDVSLPPSSALLVLAALNLATLLPLVPGNAGVYEAAVVLAYVHLGLSPERALSMAAVQHAVYFVALALPGYRWLARARPSPSAAAAAP